MGYFKIIILINFKTTLFDWTRFKIKKVQVSIIMITYFQLISLSMVTGYFKNKLALSLENTSMPYRYSTNTGTHVCTYTCTYSSIAIPRYSSTLCTRVPVSVHTCVRIAILYTCTYTCTVLEYVPRYASYSSIATYCNMIYTCTGIAIPVRYTCISLWPYRYWIPVSIPAILHYTCAGMAIQYTCTFTRVLVACYYTCTRVLTRRYLVPYKHTSAIAWCHTIAC